jgi:sodium:neurotransmitter symporter family protein
MTCVHAMSDTARVPASVVGVGGKRELWSGRAGFILANIASAVGLGSIWKFPYEVGANGGGAFVLLYLIGLTLIVLPLMLAELALGIDVAVRMPHDTQRAAMRAKSERVRELTSESQPSANLESSTGTRGTVIRTSGSRSPFCVRFTISVEKPASGRAIAIPSRPMAL